MASNPHAALRLKKRQQHYREWLRQRIARAARADANLCTECGEPRDRGDRQRCEWCRINTTMRQDTYQFRKREGLRR